MKVQMKQPLPFFADQQWMVAPASPLASSSTAAANKVVVVVDCGSIVSPPLLTSLGGPFFFGFSGSVVSSEIRAAESPSFPAHS